MRTTQQTGITLPIEKADEVKSKVASGDYEIKSEVIRDSSPVLMTHDRAMEHWLRGQAGPACDALKADPSGAVPIAQVRRMLAAIHKTANAKM